MADLGSYRYIQRVAEQRRIIEEAELVLATRKSRILFVYGRGGMGKTRLLRQLSKVITNPKIKCLASPIDVDDSQHWLLSNMERYVAEELDPDKEYFAPFHEYISRLPRHRITPASRETILSHLNQIKAVFSECYQKYIDETGRCVVITFDTTESIRGMHLLRVFTEWIKSLPSTLIVLAGRSPADPQGWTDPVRVALGESGAGMPVTAVTVGEFDVEDCRAYLKPLREKDRLPAETVEKLVHLTQGHPLWLALTVHHIDDRGVPEDAHAPLADIQRDLPYHGAPTPAGRPRSEEFKLHLVAPYRDADFRHEAIRRLAIIRESVSLPIWKQLMEDTALPEGVADFEAAWDTLRHTEWIRLRANRHYVTLHDAVAEELTRRVIDPNDPDGRRRKALWSRAASIYEAACEQVETEIKALLPDVNARLRAWDAGARDGDAAAARLADDRALIDEVTELDNRQQELNQLKVANLFYRLLSDFRAGAALFVEMILQARADHDVLLEDLLAFQMQNFLPGTDDESVLDDTVGQTIRRFRQWLLRGDGVDSFVDVGLEVADYLIHREQPRPALELLRQLQMPVDRERRYRIRNLQGNACLRVPGRIRESGERFQDALTEASQFPGSDQDRYSAEAYKELGIYYRNIGRWKEADASYKLARDAISSAFRDERPRSDRAQLASIYNNWAYVKGIGGRYDEGITLIGSAIDLRTRLELPLERAISFSVKGEVYRYQREFKAAWDAYMEAEQLFKEQNSWPWLGMIYQEQAICLCQSIPAQVQLLDPKLGGDPISKAEELIEHSLDLCQNLNVRAYPSALNRAGRIFQARDPDRGLGYLLEAAEQARELSDGWIRMASLVEYAEVSYNRLTATGEPAYRDRIQQIRPKVQDAEDADLEFPELRGRWRVLQGHLEMRRAVATGSDEALRAAVESYRTGFPMIMHGWVGSYGVSAIPREFEKSKKLAWELPEETRKKWRWSLFSAWSGLPGATRQLLPLLEDLY